MSKLLGIPDSSSQRSNLTLHDWMANVLCCDVYSDDILRSEFLYNLCASEELKQHFMLGKCFTLLSSVFPSGTYLGKCTETPGTPYLSFQGTAISVGALLSFPQQSRAYCVFASICPLPLFNASPVVLYLDIRNLSKNTVFSCDSLGAEYFSRLLVVTSLVFKKKNK